MYTYMTSFAVRLISISLQYCRTPRNYEILRNTVCICKVSIIYYLFTLFFVL